MNISALVAANAARWARANTLRGPEFEMVANRLIKEKPTYQRVQAATSVPWFIVAVIHERECSGSFKGSLAQGDPWDRVSTHVPKGRGPFKTWYDAAIDALVNCDPHAAKWADWSPGGALTLLEQYNGLGYANKGRPSPYIWSGTDQYTSGKYVRDGVYDANAVDRQLGCAGLLKALQKADPTITFGTPVPQVTPVPPQRPVQPVSPPPDVDVHAKTGGFLNALYGLVQGFLKRKK